jgi:hypothetical protein
VSPVGHSRRRSRRAAWSDAAGGCSLFSLPRQRLAALRRSRPC